MANLVAGRKIVPELLQGEANPGRIAALGLKLLTSPERLQGIRAELERVKAKLGTPGASTRAAQEVLKVLGQEARS
jgi:lipid-A-disaccharide synthase